LSGIVRCDRCVDAEGNHVRLFAKPHQAGTRYACPQCHLSIEAERTNELVEGDLLDLLDVRAWRKLRQGRRKSTGVDTAEFEKSVETLSARFVAGDIDAVEFADLAESLRLQHEIANTPSPTLPNVDNVKRAWPKLDFDARRLVISAATQSLTIKPWANTKGFDESRVVWVPVA
jgi:hypothetical protein